MLRRYLILLTLLAPMAAVEPLAVALPAHPHQGVFVVQRADALCCPISLPTPGDQVDPWLELGRVLRRHGDARLIKDAVVDADSGQVDQLPVALPGERLHGVIVLSIPAEVEREAVVERYRALRQALAQSAASGIDWQPTALALRAPQQYRQEVLEAITDDIGHIVVSLGPGYAAEIQGLSAPLTIRPHSGLDLRLSISYAMRIHQPERGR